ncbi:MAG: hypothetical protein KC420_03345 [Myxococcales bacterium]|nr:hypothetical protein [Myxococcales bacterium]
MSRPTIRTLMIDGVTYAWHRAHTHVEVNGERRCVERVSAWIEGSRGASLIVRLHQGQGGHTAAGSGWGGFDGGVLMGRAEYNLNRPAVVAALIRAALARGWAPREGRGLEIDDGFALLVAGRAPTGR